MFPIPETNYKDFLLWRSFWLGLKKNSCAQHKEKIMMCMIYSHQWSWDTLAGKRTTDKNEQDIPVPIDLHSGPLMERFALLGVKLWGGALVEDPWLGSSPPEKGKMHLPWFHKTCVLPLDLHHYTCGMFNFYLVGVTVDGIGYRSSLVFVVFFFFYQHNLL